MLVRNRWLSLKLLLNLFFVFRFLWSELSWCIDASGWMNRSNFFICFFKFVFSYWLCIFFFSSKNRKWRARLEAARLPFKRDLSLSTYLAPPEQQVFEFQQRYHRSSSFVIEYWLCSWRGMQTICHRMRCVSITLWCSNDSIAIRLSSIHLAKYQSIITSYCFCDLNFFALLVWVLGGCVLDEALCIETCHQDELSWCSIYEESRICSSIWLSIIGKFVVLLLSFLTYV